MSSQNLTLKHLSRRGFLKGAVAIATGKVLSGVVTSVSTITPPSSKMTGTSEEKYKYWLPIVSAGIPPLPNKEAERVLAEASRMAEQRIKSWV